MIFNGTPLIGGECAHESVNKHFESNKDDDQPNYENKNADGNLLARFIGVPTCAETDRSSSSERNTPTNFIPRTHIQLKVVHSEPFSDFGGVFSTFQKKYPANAVTIPIVIIIINKAPTVMRSSLPSYVFCEQ